MLKIIECYTKRVYNKSVFMGDWKFMKFKIKKMLIIFLIVTLIYPVFLSTISLAYEEVEKNKVDYQDEKNDLELGEENEGNKTDVETQNKEKEENIVIDKKEQEDEKEEKNDKEENNEEKSNKKEENIKTYYSKEEKTQEPEKDTDIKMTKKILNESASEQLTKGDGVYTISTALNNNKVLDVSGGSKENNANIQIWENSNVPQQKFQIKYNESGKYYQIISVNSNKSLDVQDLGTTNGTNVQQYETKKIEAQQWILKSAGDGYYYIISKCNGLYLDVANGIANNGTNIQMYEGNESKAQKFKFSKVEELEKELISEQLTKGDGVYTISTALNDNKVLDVSGGSKENNANIQIWENSNVPQQKFQIKYNESGKYYQIISVNSNKSLDVQDLGTTNGTNVQQYETKQIEAQQWILKSAGDGYYYIISKCNELYLDVTNGIANNGTNIQMYEGNESTAQKFKFTYIPELISEKITEGDGVYTISTALNSNKVLDIAAGSKENNANIQLWENTNVQQQKFQIKYNESGKYYQILSVNSSKSLDVEDSGTRNGTNVQQYEAKQIEAQQWVLRSAGDGYYYIISKCNGLYLDVTNAVANNGTNIQMYEGNETIAQKFKLKKVPTLGNDYYKISIKSDNNKYLDIDGGSTEEGANLQIWENSNVNQQVFKVEYIDDTYCKVTARHSDKVLTVENNDCVVQRNYTNEINQQWSIEVTEDGYYKLKSRKTGKYLDLINRNIVNGTKVQTCEGNNTNTQKFKFEKVVIGMHTTYNFTDLEESKYPGYKELLQQLQNKYPNWSLRIFYTGLDWNEVINQEDQFSGGSPKSLIQDSYDSEWINGYEKYDVSQAWYRASKKAIAYMMDPRNSLTDAWIFQFQDLESSLGTREEIAKMTEGTFLHTDSLINTIMSTSQEQRISPFHLVSRIIQEQGGDGKGTMNGNYQYLRKNNI